MNNNSFRQRPPMRARTVEEVAELSSALHDSSIDIEGIRWERHERRIVSVRLPLELDREDWDYLPGSQWELVIRNPTRLRIDDGAFIGSYMLNVIEASAGRVAIRCSDPLTVELEVGSLDVAVEARATYF